jgi:hypothetical protein
MCCGAVCSTIFSTFLAQVFFAVAVFLGAAAFLAAGFFVVSFFVAIVIQLP